MKDFSLFIESLKKLISFKTVKEAPMSLAPFGNQNRLALEYVLSLAESFGFKTINYDGYGGEVYFGEGEEIGIIGHLDVVPEGHGWNTDPYELTLKDGVYYARGVADDKGPTLACLFALKELKDLGVSPKVRFRLFFGVNEESGWKDVEYLKTKTCFPKKGFSPDGNFPVIYAEKGPARIDFFIPILTEITEFSTGVNVANAVPSYAFLKGKIDRSIANELGLKINGDKIESFGVAAHGSKPSLGKNAVKPLFEYLNKQTSGAYKDIIDNLFNDKAGIGKIGNETGYATFSPNLVKILGEEIVVSVDFRVPAKLDLDDFIPILNSFNLKYEIKSYRKPHYVDPKEPFVETLLSAYNKVTKRNDSAVTCSGATFSSVFEKGVAFGGEFPWSNTKIHEPNENFSEKDFLLLYEIYKTAIFELAK